MQNSDSGLLVAGCLQYWLCIAVVLVYHDSNILQPGGVAKQDPCGRDRSCGLPCALEPGKSCQHSGGACRGDHICPGKVFTCGEILAGSKSRSLSQQLAPNDDPFIEHFQIRRSGRSANVIVLSCVRTKHAAAGSDCAYSR